MGLRAAGTTFQNRVGIGAASGLVGAESSVELVVGLRERGWTSYRLWLRARPGRVLEERTRSAVIGRVGGPVTSE